MILLDLTDAEKVDLARVLRRLAQGMNISQSQKDVAIKVARQLFLDKVEIPKR